MAGTFMHELGHCLGLDHGGGDGTNNKPNYVSVMNYLWQFSGVTRGGTANIVDYSNAALANLNEKSLDETVVLAPPRRGLLSVTGATHACRPRRVFVQVADGSQPDHWDGDGLTTKKNIPVDMKMMERTGPSHAVHRLEEPQAGAGGAIGAGGSDRPPEESSVVDITLAEQRLNPLSAGYDAAGRPPRACGQRRTPQAGNRTNVQITFTATDDISGVARTECDVDGAGNVA